MPSAPQIVRPADRMPCRPCAPQTVHHVDRVPRGLCAPHMCAPRTVICAPRGPCTPQTVHLADCVMQTVRPADRAARADCVSRRPCAPHTVRLVDCVSHRCPSDCVLCRLSVPQTVRPSDSALHRPYVPQTVRPSRLRLCIAQTVVRTSLTLTVCCADIKLPISFESKP